jgi:hypothetical protein
MLRIDKQKEHISLIVLPKKKFFSSAFIYQHDFIKTLRFPNFVIAQQALTKSLTDQLLSQKVPILTIHKELYSDFALNLNPSFLKAQLLLINFLIFQKQTN